MDPVNVLAKFEVRSFKSVPEIIAMEVLGWGYDPQSWGRGVRRRLGVVPFERALVSSYALHCNFSSIFMSFGDIAAFAR